MTVNPMAKNKGRLAIILYLVAFACLLAPLGVWVWFNREDYFTQSTSTSLSLGLSLALGFAFLMIFGAFKEFDKRITVFLSLGVVALLAYLLDPILDDLMWIAICALMGYAVYIPLTLIARTNWSYFKEFRKEKVRVEARKEAETDTGGLSI